MAEYENALMAGNHYRRIPGSLFYTLIDDDTSRKLWDIARDADNKYEQSLRDEEDEIRDEELTKKRAENKKWNEIKRQVSPQVGGSMLNALRFGKDFGAGFLNQLFGMNEEGYTDEGYMDKLWNVPMFHKRNPDGSLSVSLTEDTFPELLAKAMLKRRKEKMEQYNDAIEPTLEELMAGDGAGEKQSGGVTLPGIGAMPKISMPDYAALRKKLDELDIDTQYEAPQKNPLVMIGQALANIDLTSNLAGDWSKTAKIAADFQQYNEEQAKSAKNKNADKKAEIAMWKAMKDISLQEAEANAAMKQAEFGLRWQQAKMNAAMQQAKANMFYGPNGYYGRLTKAQLDYADMQKAENLGKFAGEALKKEKPKMTSEQAMKVLMPKLTQMKAMGFPQNRVNSYINGYLIGVTGGTQGDK